MLQSIVNNRQTNDSTHSEHEKENCDPLTRPTEQSIRDILFVQPTQMLVQYQQLPDLNVVENTIDRGNLITLTKRKGQEYGTNRTTHMIKELGERRIVPNPRRVLAINRIQRPKHKNQKNRHPRGNLGVLLPLSKAQIPRLDQAQQGSQGNHVGRHVIWDKARHETPKRFHDAPRKGLVVNDSLVRGEVLLLDLSQQHLLSSTQKSSNTLTRTKTTNQINNHKQTLSSNSNSFINPSSQINK
mmetsp:Transcript_18855/g.40893  ORF Transcript_18855/g.40893 Transcript_18855/m.40893 type:complete len:242 (+) Transcript_18855:2000-2725(+)